jgi:hypothetical protein
MRCNPWNQLMNKSNRGQGQVKKGKELTDVLNI